MLKGLAILAVFLTIAQAPMPTTGQTANNGTQGSSSKKQAAKNDKDKAAPVSSSQEPSPSETKAPSTDTSKENKEIPVSVVKLPTVAVDSNRLDYFTFGVSVLVLIVAACGVYYAKRTLDQIADQAASLHEHAEHFQRLAGSAADNAAAARLHAQALLNSERPWIVVSVESPERNVFAFKATNVGKTPAIITSICPFMVPVSRTDKFKVSPQFEKGENLYLAALPLLLPPTASHIFSRRNIEELDKRQPTDVWLRQLANGIFTVFSYGKIIYSDTLKTGEPHETGWCYVHFPLEGAMPIPDAFHPEYNYYE